MWTPRRHLPLLGAGLVVLVATLACYANTLSASFVAWDDGITIYNNPQLGDLSLDRLAWAFTDVATTMRWIPLTLLSLTLTHTFHGLDPFGYHLANWLIHGASALAVFLLLRELLGRDASSRDPAAGRDDPWVLACAAAGALAWSLHPLRVEVVAWSNSRGHAQAGLFTFLSLLAYLRAHRQDRPAPHFWRATVLPAALYLAALTSHPIAIGAAPVFVLLDLHLGRLGGQAGWWNPSTRRVMAEKLPFVAVTLAVLVVTLLIRTFSSGMWPAPVPLSQWGLFPRALQATYAWLHYAVVTLWPVGLQPAPTELIDFDPWTAPFLVRAVAVPAISLILFLRRSRWPSLLVAWLAWLALCFPALGLTEHPMFACDRYTNLPGLVPAALLAGALLRLGSDLARRRLAALAAAALLALLGGLSHVQARVWSDSISLFEHMLPLIGDDPYRQNIVLFLGMAYVQADRPDAAAAILAQAAEVTPTDPTVRITLGDALTALGRAPEAARHYLAALAIYQDALRADPTDATQRIYLARTLARLGRATEAVATLEVAIGLAPGDAGLRCALAESLRLAGRAGEAAAQARRAVQLDPRSTCGGRR